MAASADNRYPSEKSVRFYGKAGAGTNTGIDIYYVTNNNYDDFKLYDTKASHERGITYKMPTGIGRNVSTATFLIQVSNIVSFFVQMDRNHLP